MTDEEEQKVVVDGISLMIRYHLNTAATEQRYPSPDSDGSDDIICDSLNKVRGLRKIREEFENLITGVILR
jgi:hypothetical protein